MSGPSPDASGASIGDAMLDIEEHIRNLNGAAWALIFMAGGIHPTDSKTSDALDCIAETVRIHAEGAREQFERIHAHYTSQKGVANERR